MSKLFISDQRMLQLMTWAVRKGIADNETDFLDRIGFVRNNLRRVKAGEQGFTKEHILNACELTGASADYIFGFTNMISRKQQRHPIEQLKEAVLAVELELKQR